MNPKTPPTAATILPSNQTPDFLDIVTALAHWKFPGKFDGVVGIASGGLVPAALVAQHLRVGLKTISISYRNTVNEPQFAQPKVISAVPGLGGWKRVLLVDDVWYSGKSWDTARAHLPKRIEILPFVLQGDVEFALFRGPAHFVRWPWSAA